jgi:outer membrane protein TolC
MPFIGNAQEKKALELTIQEAIDYAHLHNANIINANIDIEIARAKVRETTAIGLPQVSASGSYTNFLDIATTLIPDFISPSVIAINEGMYGLTPTVPGGGSEDPTYVEAKFGTEHNAEIGVTASLLLFNGSYIVGLQAAKAYVQQTHLAKIKTKNDLTESVKQSYHMVLISQRNLEILDDLILNLESTLAQTKALVDEGFIEEVSYDQLKLMKSELDASKINGRNMSLIANYYLKLTLGLNIEDELLLKDNIDNLVSTTEKMFSAKKEFYPYKNIEYQIIQNQKKLALLDVRNKKAEYLPVLSTFFSAKQNAMRNEFNFFEDNNDKWFPTTLWGLQLDIPIFNSGMKSAQLKQKKLVVKQLENAENTLETSLQIEFQNAKANYENTYLLYINKKESIEIARKIYEQTELKFTEGMAGRTDLNQAHDQLLQANSNYLNAILELLNSKAKFDKLLSDENN